MKSLAAALATGITLAAMTAHPAELERWLRNPRQHTAAGITAWTEGRPAQAVERLELALSLDASDATVAYNAGTAYLAAERPAAVLLLERSLAAAPAELLPDGYYNLGNAQLAAENFAAAAAAYKQALLADPSFFEAKFNLELALRRLQEQQQQRRAATGSNQEEQEPDEPRRREQPDSGAGDETMQQMSGDAARDDGAVDGLERFETQPDMTAQQAAAILRAVENLERQQRRRLAKERAERRRKGDRDW